MLALTAIYNHWTINVSEQKFPHRQATAPASIRKLSAGPSSGLDCDKMARHTPWTTAERPLPQWKSHFLGSVQFINTTSSKFLLVCELNRAIRRLACLMHSPTCLTPINIYENTARIHPARALACLKTPPRATWQIYATTSWRIFRQHRAPSRTATLRTHWLSPYSSLLASEYHKQ